MRIKELLTGDDAVSPVIGVILMVAITVILAAVIAAFVLGLGDTSDPAPQVSFDYDYNDADASPSEVLDVTVESGDTFDAGNVNVVVDGNSEPLTDFSSFGDGSTISAGDEFTINDTTNGHGTAVEAGDRVDITFTPESGGESNVIGTFTAPEN